MFPNDAAYPESDEDSEGQVVAQVRVQTKSRKDASEEDIEEATKENVTAEPTTEATIRKTTGDIIGNTSAIETQQALGSRSAERKSIVIMRTLVF